MPIHLPRRDPSDRRPAHRLCARALSPAPASRTDNGSTPLINACGAGRLAAATLLLDAGADTALLDNGGWSALRWAEDRVVFDDEEPEEGEEPPTAAQAAEHKALVALLKARGAV